jgi:hypothetical protein
MIKKLFEKITGVEKLKIAKAQAEQEKVEVEEQVNEEEKQSEDDAFHRTSKGSRQKNKSFDQWLISKKNSTRWFIYYLLVAEFICFGVFNRTDFIYFQF